MARGEKRRPRRELSKKQRREQDQREGTRRQNLDFTPKQYRSYATSKRDFFHMVDRQETHWHEMLRDAPSDYSIFWIDELADPKLRDYLRQAYIGLRQEQATAEGVSFMRDLMIRRLLWCARIAQRYEGLIEQYAYRDMIEPTPNGRWAGRLEKAERYYSHLTEVMTDICLHLHRTGPKRKKAQDTGVGRLGTGTVQIPVDDT